MASAIWLAELLHFKGAKVSCHLALGNGSTLHGFNSLNFNLYFVTNYKEIQPVHPKGDQSWVFIGRTDAEADIKLVLWPPHVKS